MRLRLKIALKSEFSRFLNLTPSARALATSIWLYQIADIGIFMFAYAFLFQSNQDFSTVAWFNLGFYFTLPLGYLLNAWLLRSISLRTASLLGLVGQAAVFFSLFFSLLHSQIQLL